MGMKGYRPPILMDVDGVLANFTLSFTKLCNSIDSSGNCKIIYEPKQVNHWDFRDVISENIQAQAWDFIRASETWWLDLQPLLLRSAFDWLNELKIPVLYISSREGRKVANQTHEWLQSYGVSNPNVLIVPNGHTKVNIANCLKARYIIDDRPSTLKDLVVVNFIQPRPIRILAPKYPYNADIDGVLYYEVPGEMFNALEYFIRNE